MTRKKRICECTTWEPRPHEPCGDSECGECADCEDCGGKGFYFITSDDRAGGDSSGRRVAVAAALGTWMAEDEK